MRRLAVFVGKLSVFCNGFMAAVAAPVAQTTLAPKAPVALSLDPGQMQQLTRSLTTLQQTVEQLATGQHQMAQDIEKLQTADVEILAKIPAPPPPRPVAAPARKTAPIARRRQYDRAYRLTHSLNVRLGH